MMTGSIHEGVFDGWRDAPARSSFVPSRQKLSWTCHTGLHMAKLNDEQRRALQLLARHPVGCAEVALLAEGFSVGQLAALVMDGFAERRPIVTNVGGREKFVVWMQINAAVGLRSPISLHHSLSALRPASVISIIVTRTARRLWYAGSRSAVASPFRTSPCSIPIAKPCANISDSVSPRTQAARVNCCNHQKLQASPGTCATRRTGPGGRRLTAPRLPLPFRMAEVAICLD
jgi:hypothetical protein